MHFSYCLSAEAPTLDQAEDLRDQLTAAGHEFVITPRELLPPPWVNLFSEFTPEVTLARVRQRAAEGYHLVCLVTEMPTLVTRGGLVWNYHTEPWWLARAELFVDMAPHLTAAWCYVPGAAAQVKRFVPRAAQVDMAYGARFERPRAQREPKHDFCFFGTLTKRRGQIVDTLRRAGFTVDVIPFQTLAERDSRVLDAKVVLDLKQFEWWPMVSTSRYVTALQLGRPVAAEHRPLTLSAGWEKVVAFAKDDTDAALLATAAAALADWSGLYRRQLAALRARQVTIAKAVTVLPRIRAMATPTSSLSVSYPQVPMRVMGPTQFYGTPTLLGSMNDVNIVGYRDAVYTVPHAMGTVHLDRESLPRHPIREFQSLAEAELAMAQAAA